MNSFRDRVNEVVEGRDPEEVAERSLLEAKRKTQHWIECPIHGKLDAANQGVVYYPGNRNKAVAKCPLCLKQAHAEAEAGLNGRAIRDGKILGDDAWRTEYKVRTVFWKDLGVSKRTQCGAKCMGAKPNSPCDCRCLGANHAGG